mmetsp:Transcript_2286/g.8959  ORF Transcript_2286/g.8959 Transcript_2286/m.8959 type:complete len:132 (+) Transcript_2286:2371-2766(+)
MCVDVPKSEIQGFLPSAGVAKAGSSGTGGLARRDCQLRLRYPRRRGNSAPRSRGYASPKVFKYHAWCEDATHARLATMAASRASGARRGTRAATTADDDDARDTDDTDGRAETESLPRKTSVGTTMSARPR